MKINKNILEIQNHFFDIETSKIPTTAGTIVPVTFLTCLLTYDLDNDKEVKTVFNRNIVQSIETFKKLNTNGKYNVIYCHNLSYEYSFLYNAAVNLNIGINVEESIFSNKSPLKIKLQGMDNVEFRCSKALLDMSVSELGKRIGMPKLQYNYDIIRLATDKLTELDYEYNKTDCLIVAKYMAKEVSEGRYPANEIPLTKTAIVRKGMNDFIKMYYPTNNVGKDNIRSLARHKRNQLFTKGFYDILLKTFKGGLVGSNPEFTNKIINNVYSIDVKSHYPSVMFNKFPLFAKDEDDSLLTNEKATRYVNLYLNNKNHPKLKDDMFVGNFLFTNLKAKDDNMILPISNTDNVKIKGYGIEATEITGTSTVINGKVHYAKMINISLTEQDLDVINQCYTFDKMFCNKIYITRRSRFLPEGITSYILSKFATKETVEDKDSIERKHAKVDLNSIFGCMAMKQIMPTYELSEDGYSLKEVNYVDKKLTEQEQEKLFSEHMKDYYSKTCSTNFNIFADGIWITSYARKALVEMQLGLKEVGCKLVYTDTDSVKFTIPDEVNKDKVFKYIDSVNNEMLRRNKNNPGFKAFKALLSYNKNCKEITGKTFLNKEDWNKIYALGQWQVENFKDETGNYVPYKYFKTLGSKKYAYTTNTNNETEVVKTVIAGCSTKLGNVITSYAERKGLNLGFAIDQIFKPKMILDAKVSGHTVTSDIDPKSDLLKNICFDTANSNDKGIYERTEGIIKIKDEYSGRLIEESCFTLDIDVNTAKTMYNMTGLDIHLLTLYTNPDIFDGNRIIRSI